MLNLSQKNNISLPTIQHLAAIKQNVLNSYFLVKQKNKEKFNATAATVAPQKYLNYQVRPFVKGILDGEKKALEKDQKIRKERKKIKAQVRKRMYLKSLKIKNVRRLSKKAYILKRFNNLKFRLPKNLPGLFHYSLAISIKKNNAFCTFSSIKEKNKTLLSCNAGSYKIKVTKKTLRYTYDLVLRKFYFDVKKKYFRIKRGYKKREAKTLIQRGKQKTVDLKKGLIVTIVIPKRLRKKVVKNLRKNFKKIPLLIKAVDKKVFNGCRAPKSIRKKRQRRLRLYK